MTDLDLDAIEARANAATEGPWLAYDERSDLREENPDVNPMWVVAHMEPDGVNWVRDIADIGGGEQDETDAEFIAHARTDVPALVAALREARAEVERTLEYVRNADARVIEADQRTDDWRRRYEALREGVVAQHRKTDVQDYCNHEDRDACEAWELESGVWLCGPVIGEVCQVCRDEDGDSVPWPCETAAVVARVEGDES